MHVSLQGVSVLFPAPRAADRSRGFLPLVFPSRCCLACLRLCQQCQRVAVSFKCTACAVIRAKVQPGEWSRTGYSSMALESPESLMWFQANRLKCCVCLRGLRGQLKFVEIRSTRSHGQQCSPMPGPTGSTLPGFSPQGTTWLPGSFQKLSFFGRGSGPLDLLLQGVPRGPGIPQQAAGRDPPQNPSFLKDLCSQMTVSV